MVQQVLDGRYVVEAKLVQLLKDTFGVGNYKWEVR